MTLPASGNSISLSQVNTELGRSATATIDMNDSAVRTLFGVGGSGTTISMSSGFGKSSFAVGYTTNFTNDYFVEDVYVYPGPTGVGLRWNTDGTMDQFYYDYGYSSLGERWASPATAGAGSNYWIRFTRTFTSSSAAGAASTASTGWLQLSSAREIVLQRYPAFMMQVKYTVEISSSSSGSPVLSTRTNIALVTTDSSI